MRDMNDFDRRLRARQAEFDRDWTQTHRQIGRWQWGGVVVFVLTWLTALGFIGLLAYAVAHWAGLL